MSKELERDIQSSIIQYLKLKRYLFIKVNTVGIYKKSTDRYIPSQSVGAPDILVFLDGGIAIAIEVKTSVGKLSEFQKEWQRKSEKIGMTYLIARSVVDVMRVGL